MIEAEVLSHEEEMLVRECIADGADSMSLSRDVDIYYAPYSLRNYITDQEKNDGIFWLECEGENNWGYFDSDEQVYEIFSNLKTNIGRSEKHKDLTQISMINVIFSNFLR